MLMRLSPIMPSPIQRCMPRSPLSRQRLSPWRRLTALMRPSQPVLHFCPLRNQGFFCSRFRSALLVLRFGTQTRFTPRSCASFSLRRSKSPHHQRPNAARVPVVSRALRSPDQKRRVGRPLLIHFIADDDLILRSWIFTILPISVGLLAPGET